MNVIIQSKKKGQRNWSGKEFSSNPARIYPSWEDAAQALTSFWFNDCAKDYNGQVDERQIIIIPLTDYKTRELLGQGKVRW